MRMRLLSLAPPEFGFLLLLARMQALLLLKVLLPLLLLFSLLLPLLRLPLLLLLLLRFQVRAGSVLLPERNWERRADAGAAGGVVIIQHDDVLLPVLHGQHNPANHHSNCKQHYNDYAGDGRAAHSFLALFGPIRSVAMKLLGRRTGPTF